MSTTIFIAVYAAFALGSIVGYFICAMATAAKISDLHSENWQLRRAALTSPDQEPPPAFRLRASRFS
jgi:hypothetical protein